MNDLIKYKTKFKFKVSFYDHGMLQLLILIRSTLTCSGEEEEMINFLFYCASLLVLYQNIIPRKEGATVGRDMSGVASNSSISEFSMFSSRRSRSRPGLWLYMPECNFIHQIHFTLDTSRATERPTLRLVIGPRLLTS